MFMCNNHLCLQNIKIIKRVIMLSVILFKTNKTLH